jgi:hypothetical protein
MNAILISELPQSRVVQASSKFGPMLCTLALPTSEVIRQLNHVSTASFRSSSVVAGDESSNPDDIKNSLLIEIKPKA